MHQVPEAGFDPKVGAMIAAEIIRGEIARMSIEVADDAIDIEERTGNLSDALREIRTVLRARDYDMVCPLNLLAVNFFGQGGSPDGTNLDNEDVAAA